MSDKYISQEQMERIRSARIKYEEALFTKQGVPQAKTTLGNLLISSVGGILSMMAQEGKGLEEIEDLREQNDALSAALEEKHKEIARLKEELGAAQAGKARRKAAGEKDGALAQEGQEGE